MSLYKRLQYLIHLIKTFDRNVGKGLKGLQWHTLANDCINCLCKQCDVACVVWKD